MISKDVFQNKNQEHFSTDMWQNILWVDLFSRITIFVNLGKLHFQKYFILKSLRTSRMKLFTSLNIQIMLYLRNSRKLASEKGS